MIALPDKVFNPFVWNIKIKQKTKKKPRKKLTKGTSKTKI